LGFRSEKSIFQADERTGVEEKRKGEGRENYPRSAKIFDVSRRLSSMSAVLELLDRRFERLEAYVQLAVSNRERSSA
jgi:hypothetical protein